MKRLIINSDDYGRTPEISRGIREAHLKGVVTSTTCMMNIPTTASDVAIALKETPKLGAPIDFSRRIANLMAGELLPLVVHSHDRVRRRRNLRMRRARKPA